MSYVPRIKFIWARHLVDPRPYSPRHIRVRDPRHAKEYTRDLSFAHDCLRQRGRDLDIEEDVSVGEEWVVGREHVVARGVSFACIFFRTKRN